MLWQHNHCGVYFVILCIYGQLPLVYRGHKSCFVGALMRCLQPALHWPFLQNLTVADLVKKSVATNGTQRFKKVSCKIPQSAPTLNQLKAFYTLARYLRPSFISPFSPRCRHAVFLSGVPLICVFNPMPTTAAAYPTKLIFDLITVIVFSGNIKL
jgi:hypothetical protein